MTLQYLTLCDTIGIVKGQQNKKGKIMDATFIMSKETKEKLNKPLKTQRKTRLLINKLEKLEDEGIISAYKTRAQLARALGYGYGEKEKRNGYLFVSRAIKKGIIEATLVGVSNNGAAEYEFHVNKSRIENDAKTTAKTTETTTKTATETEAKKHEPVESEPVESDSVEPARTYNFVLKGNGKSLEIETSDNEVLDRLIQTFLEGAL